MGNLGSLRLRGMKHSKFVKIYVVVCHGSSSWQPPTKCPVDPTCIELSMLLPRDVVRSVSRLRVSWHYCMAETGRYSGDAWCDRKVWREPGLHVLMDCPTSDSSHMLKCVGHLEWGSA